MLKFYRKLIPFAALFLFISSGFMPTRAQKTVPLQKTAFSGRLAAHRTRYLSRESLIGMPQTSPRPAVSKINPAQVSSRGLAESFLKSNKAWFGLRNIQEDLKLTRIRTSPAGEHLTYDAYIQDFPVYRSQIVVSINRRSEISFVMSNFRRDLHLTRKIPELTAEQALEISSKYLHLSGSLTGEPETLLMVFETIAGGARLAYRVRLPASDPLGDWQLFVDAGNGNILEVTNALCFKSGIQDSGAVWIPDPLTMAEKYYGDEGFTDNHDQDNDSLNYRRLIVPLMDLDEQGTSADLLLKGPYISIDEGLLDPKYRLSPGLDSTEFIFTRAQPEFEAVMVYYHADHSYRRLLELGFSSSELAALKADPHGSYTDYSFYSPFGNYCAFGEGGVDDAEDATVIWHEVTHAIQHNLSNVQFGAGGETFSLIEGAADYWAASYRRRLSGFDWPQLFIWDAGIKANGDTTFWAGRRCDKDWHYPEDYQIYEGTHAGGQIWSSVLMHIWTDLGADVSDALFLQSHYYWNVTPGFREAAESMIQADRDLFESSHLVALTYWFDYFGFIDRNDYMPQIIHEKHKDTEDLNGPYLISCQILGGETAPDPENLWLFWQTDALEIDSLRLINTGTDKYSAQISGTGMPATISYYLRAGDSLNQVVYFPANAPLERCIFQTGPDTLIPLIEHEELGDQLLVSWPPEINALITDNLGIDSAWVEFYSLWPDSLDWFYLQAGDSDVYSGTFPSDVAGLQDGDTIHYRILARDRASLKNQNSVPEEGFYYFILYQNPSPPQGVQVLDRNDKVLLGWEENKQKVPVFYRIYRSRDVPTFMLLDSTVQTQYTDTTVSLGGKYHYYLTTVFGEWESIPSDTVEVMVEGVVSLTDHTQLTKAFRLDRNYPNPFNPRTRIHYELPMAAHVQLQIFNILGQKVVTLVSEKQPAGMYDVEWDAGGWASGVYFYRLQAGNFIQVHKLILLK